MRLLLKEVYKIHSRIGSYNGPLFLYINAKLYREKNNEVDKKLKSLVSKVDKFYEVKGIS
jgi:hypothetical protein